MDRHASAAAQLLSDSVLHSSSSDDVSDVGSAAAEFARCGASGVGATVSLTGALRSPPSGVGEDDYTAALERCVLDAAAALVAVACGTPELLTVLMAPGVTHFALGASAQGAAGLVRVVVASLTHIAELKSVGHAHTQGTIIHAALSCAEPPAAATAGAAASHAGYAAFSATVAATAPGWDIVGAEVVPDVQAQEDVSFR